MSDFDTSLWRPVQSGNEFEHLIPKTTCQSTYVGEGYTDYSVDQMRKVIETFEHQTEKLAEKLQRQTLRATALSIHDFLFNHFQYKADSVKQLLRSPACSWYHRESGIDCKSYSIIASSLLLNMGITHYIRRIKQPGYAPTEYTHVYVIVPIDQPGGNLAKGYFTIDGTLKSTQEPAFIKKSDTRMEGLPHYALNAPANLNGINLSEFNFEKISGIKALWDKIRCIGGSSLDANGSRVHMTAVDTYFANLIQRINQAAANNNMQAFSNATAEFFGNSKVFVLGAETNLRRGWNGCTSDFIKIHIRQFKFYRDTVGALLTAWIDDNFDVTGSAGSQTYSNANLRAELPTFRHTDSNPVASFVVAKFNYTMVPSKAIKAFEITKYVADTAGAGGTVNLVTFLDGLSTVIRSFTPTPGATTPGSAVVDQPYYQTENQTVSTQQAGFGIGGLVLTGLALYFIFNNKSISKNAVSKKK